MIRIVAVVLAAALATGSAGAETRRVNDASSITGVHVSGRFRTEIVRGETPGATIEGTSGDIERLGVRVSDGDLKIWERCQMFCSRRDLDVVVRIVAPRLAVLEASKGAEVSAADIVAGQISVDVAMGAALKVTGACESLVAKVSMGGALSADGFACRSVSADASMGGAVSVRASEAAVARSSMGGAISVHGNPAKFEASGSMGGTASRAED